jgi:hypothetical protein
MGFTLKQSEYINLLIEKMFLFTLILVLSRSLLLKELFYFKGQKNEIISCIKKDKIS